MIGTTNAAIISRIDDMAGFIDSLGLADDVIIKPNWVDANTGTHTDATVLDLIFSCIKGKKTIIESYTTWRNRKYIKGSGWPKQPIKPDAGSLQKIGKDINWIRSEDRWFLANSGIGKILDKHGVQYINITEEVLAGATVSPDIIRKLVQKKFGRVKNEKLLDFVPKKLFRMKKCSLISLGKVKCDGNNVVTLSTKNLFGLIPDPSRWPKYHGYKDKNLFSNIIDINKIYRSLFDTVFVNEGVYTAMEGPWPMEINPVYGWGRIVGGRNSVEVDSITAYIMGVENVKEIPLYMNTEELGEFDESLLAKVDRPLIRPLKFW